MSNPQAPAPNALPNMTSEVFITRTAAFLPFDPVSNDDMAYHTAAVARGSLQGAIFHSDHGSVYCSKDYAKLCHRLGVTQSMGAVGSSADNALAESFNATMKREVLQDAACWSDELTCRRQVFRWLVRYNTKRRHSWCRYTSPVAFETGYTATLRPAA